MQAKVNLAVLIGEHECLIGADGTEDFVSMQDILLRPAFQTLIGMISNDLNRAQLKGNHIIRFRLDCHAEVRAEV